MNYWNKKLVRDQLEKKLELLRNYAASGTPQTGWIRAIREALGLSARQLGKRAGIDQSRISRLENAERTGNLEIASLQKIARGLHMRFVYGFVPETSLEEMVRARAREIALKRMNRLNDTMRLEEQELSEEEREKALEDMIQKIVFNQPKDFWDEDNG